jgi:hypothetical protein
MAELPTPEKSARYILAIYKEKDIRPGQGLMQQNFNIPFAQPGWRGSDWKPGMDYAIEQGWIERGQNNFYLLTDAGYKEI